MSKREKEPKNFNGVLKKILIFLIIIGITFFYLRYKEGKKFSEPEVEYSISNTEIEETTLKVTVEGKILSGNDIDLFTHVSLEQSDGTMIYPINGYPNQILSYDDGGSVTRVYIFEKPSVAESDLKIENSTKKDFSETINTVLIEATDQKIESDNETYAIGDTYIDKNVPYETYGFNSYLITKAGNEPPKEGYSYLIFDLSLKNLNEEGTGVIPPEILAKRTYDLNMEPILFDFDLNDNGIYDTSEFIVNRGDFSASNGKGGGLSAVSSAKSANIRFPIAASILPGKNHRGQIAFLISDEDKSFNLYIKGVLVMKVTL